MAAYEYDGYGQITQTAGTLTQPYGYTGREYDAESGLIYFRARSYDPVLGQFLQRDPVGFAAGDMNLYAYAWNDPYNWSDPSGLTAATEYGELAAGGASTGAIVGNVLSGALGLANNIRKFLNAIKVGQAIVNAASSDASGDDAGASAGSGSGASAEGDDENAGYHGENGKQQGGRINTDAPGGQEAADELFGELAEGEVRELPDGTREAENKVRIRIGKDGRPRVDIPASVSGNPLHETIHYNP